MIYKGFEINDANRKGGKAGNGHNVTSTVQVRKPINARAFLLEKSFRFSLIEPGGREKAVTKAKEFVDKIA